MLSVALLGMGAVQADDTNATVTVDDDIEIDGTDAAMTFADLNCQINETPEDGVLDLYGGYRYNSTSDELLADGATISKDITIVGKNNAYIDGSGAARGLNIDSNCRVVLENLTFKNGYSQNHGGAIRLGDNSTLVIRNCIFTNNSVYNSNGGAIFCRPGTDVDISDSVFENNTSIRESDLEWVEFKNGMGSVLTMTLNSSLRLVNSIFSNNNAYLSTILVVSYYNGKSNLSTLYVRNCTFENNTAISNTVLYSDELGKADIIDSVFKNNVAHEGGGIVTLDTATGSTVQNCLFDNNTAIRGGALYIHVFEDSYSSNVSVTGCNFTNNFAGTGGAIFSRHGSVNITGCNFVNNSCEGNGGGVYTIYGNLNLDNSNFSGCNASYGGAVYSRYGFVKISKCNFNMNLCEMYGGAIYSLEALLELKDSDFSRNLAVNGGAICSKRTEINATRSKFNDNYANTSGGGVYLSNSQANTLNCYFNNNTCLANGGGLYSLYGVLNLDKSNFNANVAKYGGALYLRSENSTVNDVAFTDNYALSCAGAVFSKIENVTVSKCTYSNNSDPRGRDVYSLFLGDISQTGFYYSKVVLNINIKSIWGVTLTQKIKLTFNGTEVYQTGWLTADSKGNLNIVVPNDLKVGNYSLTVKMDSGVLIPDTANVTVVEAPSKITAAKLTTSYKSDKMFAIRVMNAVTKKYLAGAKVSLKVFTGKNYKVYKLTADKNGLIKFNTSKLSTGSHSVEISFSGENMINSSLKTSIKINKASASISYPKSVKKSKKISVTVKNKLSKKVIKKTKFTVKIYTGKKYKTVKATTNSKGVLTIATKKLTRGSHKIVVTLKNTNYNVNNYFYVKVK